MIWDKKQIRKNGIYSGIPIEVYHGGADLCVGPSVSSSGLRTITAHSPAHYWCRSPLNPEGLHEEQADHFDLGKAFHHLTLGEDHFSTLFTVRPDKWADWRTKDSRDWRESQRAAGRTVLTLDQIEIIRGGAKSLSRHSLVQAGILNGAVEHSLIWEDKETGVWLRARPDVIPNDSGDFCDLKTTTDVTYDELSRTIGAYGYHQQASLVGEGYKIITGRPMTSFSFCFVEKEPPYSVRIVTLKECDLDRGSRQNRNAIRLFADCLEKGEWPGPGDTQDAEFIEIPTWMQTRIDRELEFQDATREKPKKQQYSEADYLGAP